MKTIKEAWHYIYGSGSHINLAGKLILGVPMFPFVATFVIVFALCDALFTRSNHD